MPKRALMIGLDGATFTLLDHFIAKGEMPFLASMMDNGVRAILKSTRNPLTPPAWTSMVTGRSPEAHGIYDFMRPDFTEDGGVFLKINDNRDNHCESIWSIANRAGLRATSLNFFGHAPAPEVDGYLISGFVPWRHLRHGMYPKSLLDDVKQMEMFDYKMLGMDIGEEKKCIQGLNQGEQEPWIDLQNDRDKAWADLTCHMMKTDRTELTAVVLDGPDKMQHIFWRYLDPAYLDPDASEYDQQLADRCLDFYRRLDVNLKNMVEAAGPETDIVITSDHGFGPTTEVVYLNEWLARNGYLFWRDSAEADSNNQLTTEKFKDHLSMVDWKKTVAFAPTPSSNAIFVKRDNGSGYGIKDDEYLDFILKLKAELLAAVDPADGKPIFLGAETNKLRGTTFVEPCPDITVRLRDGGFVSILKSKEVVSQRLKAEGTHRPDGIFVAYGPSFRKGERLDDLNLLDVAPLLLTLLDVPVPRDMEGKVPTAAFAEATEVKTGAATVAAIERKDDREGPSEEEREALMNQLKILGYMD
ncbi:phosphodiesterase [Acuticoccus sediminis]|uniref:Phosphodiesterase n=1 Tax=Acuticoccus sediminis TaxID=2184697 RepID=A0A8B2P1S7_9HYPH|nr:alkaline phosphatase family protein [Acuticoccus sediminis]RAI03082.1 phosphodiesterase [Acuticoccus sediminis]